MAGRRERQKQTRERRILRAAGRLFATRGYAETSIEEIAARADLAVGTIYNYFPSKPEILLSILRRDTADALAAGESILKEPPEDPAEAIGRLGEAYLASLAHEDRQLMRELLSAALTNPEAIAAPLFDLDLRLIGQLCELLRELQARGRISPQIDAGQATLTLYGVFMSWFMVSLMPEIDLDTIRTQIRNSIAVVVRGLRVEPETGDPV